MHNIGVEVDDRGVAVMTLRQPDRRNSLTLDMVGEIITAFDELESRDDVGAVVVTGAPPAFCAGADLGHLGDAQEAGLRAIYEGFLRVGRSPLPTVAAVNGAAVGAGINLALCCDLRIAARRVKATLRRVTTIDDHPEAVDAELEAQVWSLGQPDFRERLAATRQRISSKG